MEQATKKVNITQLAQWLVTATSKTGGFLLKPKDLRMLYLLLLWEYISRHNPNKRKIIKDEQISIPEGELIRMIKLFYDNTHYLYFDRIFDM